MVRMLRYELDPLSWIALKSEAPAELPAWYPPRGNPTGNINCMVPGEDEAVFTTGDTVTIRWMVRPGARLDTVQIRVYKELDDHTGLQFVQPRRIGLICRGCSAKKGMYQWTVPADFPPHEFLKIVICDVEDDDVRDMSAVFKVRSPGGGGSPTAAQGRSAAVHPDPPGATLGSTESLPNDPITLECLGMFRTFKSTMAPEDALAVALASLSDGKAQQLVEIHGGGNEQAAQGRLLQIALSAGDGPLAAPGPAAPTQVPAFRINSGPTAPNTAPTINQELLAPPGLADADFNITHGSSRIDDVLTWPPEGIKRRRRELSSQANALSASGKRTLNELMEEIMSIR